MRQKPLCYLGFRSVNCSHHCPWVESNSKSTSYSRKISTVWCQSAKRTSEVITPVVISPELVVTGSQRQSSREDTIDGIPCHVLIRIPSTCSCTSDDAPSVSPVGILIRMAQVKGDGIHISHR